MFGIAPAEFIVLLAVAAVVLGPERLPQYAQQLARMIRELRKMAQGASAQVREELGPEFEEIDWQKLDPRQYDPRRIVREALSDAWDPEDPLGLKGGGFLKDDRPGRAAAGTDDGAAGRSSTSSAGPTPASGGSSSAGSSPVAGQKPVSTGGPADVTGAPSAQGAPLFDPDAT